jgi:hypothetical protein
VSERARERERKRERERVDSSPLSGANALEIFFFREIS